jgi:HPt (histidine-containing phosphotransfer) domain-containing protein
MRDLIARYRDTATMAGFLVLLVAFIGTVLVPGYRLANDLSANSAALKLVSAQQGQPEVMMRLLAALRDQLRAGGYVGQSLKDIGTTVRQYDAALTELGDSAVQSAHIGEARKLWSTYHAQLAPVAGFTGIPYSDSDTAGTRINAAGRELLESTRNALTLGRGATPQLIERMAEIGARLERDVARDAARLRALMIAGVAFASVLVALLLYFQWLKSRHARAAREAQSQTRDILATVKEGLFLIDSEFRIGKAHSAALCALMRREKFDGMTFEDLLAPLVPAKTYDTAVKYVKLLWGERVNENLIKSINPLAEVKVNFDRREGSRDIRYLEFDFHRVKADAGVHQILVAVNDVTTRVLLARELKESQSSNSVQMDMLIGIMRVEPRQLVSFLSDSDATLKMVNTVLKVPARDDAAFRQKIEQMFREMHKLKGEAAALGLATVENRAHAFEDMLKELRDRRDLTGNDFLPLLVRLDDLFAHFKSVRELIDQLDGLRAAAQVGAISSGGTMAVQAMDVTRVLMQKPTQDVTGGLEALAQRIAGEHDKKVRFEIRGLELVPNDFLRTVRAVAIQFVRNAVVHGIEAQAQRRASGKPEVGTMQLEVSRQGDGIEMIFQDDGAGLIAEHIREVAVRRGTITADEARTLDGKAAIGLIFRPGFSTQEHETRDAGRGVGLDVVWKTVRGMGGRISVSTAPGKFTRFKIVLPAEGTQQGAVA